MSGKNTNQKSELQPRKKKRTKRKANSPLADTGQTGSENNKGQQAGRGKNRNNGQNVNIADSSNVDTRFSFVDTGGYTASPYPVAMNFPQHGQLQPQPQQQTVANKSVGESVLVFNATPATGQNMNPNMNPTYSPNQVMSQPIFSMPQTQVQSVAPPSWMSELIDDVKQIKLSITKLDQIEKTVNSINKKVSDLETKVNAMEPRVNEVEKACSFISCENDDRKKELDKAKNEIYGLKHECNSLKTGAGALREKNVALEAKVIDLETRSMRENLLFYGIPERGQNEHCEDLVKQVCEETLELNGARHYTFDRVHRIGAHSNNKIRPIVAKFHYYKEREIVREKAYEKAEDLKKINVGIGKQWPAEVRETRRVLFPIMQREKSQGKAVKMVKDKLFVNNVEYKPTPQEQHQQPMQQIPRQYPPHPPPQYGSHIQNWQQPGPPQPSPPRPWYPPPPPQQQRGQGTYQWSAQPLQPRTVQSPHQAVQQPPGISPGMSQQRPQTTQQPQASDQRPLTNKPPTPEQGAKARENLNHHEMQHSGQ